MSRKMVGLIAVAAFLGGIAVTWAQEAKNPKWSHGLMLRVRKADEPDWTKDTKRVGIEVFEDPNNGNLIYITENGNIAVIKK